MIRTCYLVGPAAAFALSIVSAVGPSAAARTPKTASLMPQIVAAYDKNVRGVIGLQRHFNTVINGGPIHHTEVSDSGLLLHDGAYVKIEYYRIVEDGKPFSTAKLAQRDAQTNSDWAAGKVFFKEPYDRRYAGDYTFVQPGNSAQCTGGTVAVNFSSAVRDIQHGNGTMCVQTTNRRVVKLTYVPNAFPPHATSGSVTETSTQVLPGVWYVTRIDETYSGHAFVVRGTATFTGVMNSFKRFASVAQGDRALGNRTI